MAASSVPTNRAPVTEEALLADRLAFFSSFTTASTYAIAAVIVLVLGMWIFLV